ncbi:MAG: hypothetical protein JKY73_04560 [Lutibacter sp.]|nr:hypothetical protein [Lutibacter sp.]
MSLPVNNDLCIDNVLNFDWDMSTDPDGDALTYQIQVSKDAQFSQIAHRLSNILGILKTLTLAKGIAYYWRVVVKDGQGEQTIGHIWNFSTDLNK